MKVVQNRDEWKRVERILTKMHSYDSGDVNDDNLNLT